MKIGVVTFFYTLENYGQMLQAYALQQHLIASGHDAFLIHIDKYALLDHSLPQRIARKRRSIWRSIKARIRAATKTSSRANHSTPSLVSQAVRSAAFKRFKKHHLKFSHRTYRSFKELLKAPPTADVYIAGSDQIWNFNFLPKLEPYFLQFGPNATKRVSYAASFGHVELPDAIADHYRVLIKSFDSISVREQSGLKLCRDLGRDDAQLVPDPTLLLDQTDWTKLCSSPAPRHREVIFTYEVGRNSAIDASVLRTVAGELNFELLHCAIQGASSGNFTPSIEEWLTTLASSKLIVTNSFHGVLFSIIFKRHFIAVPQHGPKAGMNDRLVTLLKQLGLQKHLIEVPNKADIIELLQYSIDWNHVDQKLADIRYAGQRFLRTAL